MLREFYSNEVLPKLVSEGDYKSVMHVPRILKVCLNVGFSKTLSTEKYIENVLHNLSLIAGQMPVRTYAKQSVSTFKIRKGDCIGCKVTLRKNIMYGFMERLLYVALPREKDFKGFSHKQFDGNGNLSFGIKENVVFSEVDYDTIENIFGMDVTVVTSTNSDEQAKDLLSSLGFPFIKR